MTTRRITFNINTFLCDLENCLSDNTEMIDDVVQVYKDFMDRVDEPLKTQVLLYVNKHPLVTGNEELRSYIDACNRQKK